MARMVEVKIVYDMDDQDKPLIDELRDWLNNNVNILDVVSCNNDDPSCVTIREVGAE